MLLNNNDNDVANPNEMKTGYRIFYVVSVNGREKTEMNSESSWDRYVHKELFFAAAAAVDPKYPKIMKKAYVKHI